MSEKFLQINIPCKECLVSPICEDKKRIDHKTEKLELYQFLLGLRKWEEKDKIYRKGLIEAWINLGRDIVCQYKSDEFENVYKHAGPAYYNALIEIANTLQWMINSKSWRDGEEHDFDKSELKEKLKQALAWI